MYLVTFYSFKGGVGRTMALVNTAAELVQRGRRVLLVDFDLEAPGIPTFELFTTTSERPGLVDYVSEYIGTGSAPDVRDFVSQCDSWSDAKGKLWVMSAGKQDSNYAFRLNAIDWQKLYTDHDGYLMFEDMKTQWRDVDPDGIDYVLIDSRTGHTDVGGICTRQLPDAVVAMFFPNEQNLHGLSRVVRDIRAEAQMGYDKRIKLHFAMSNLPDLDDEEGILNTWLERSKNVLGYSSLAATIHHYSSFALLDQAIFTKVRPKTRIAREYLTLVDAVVKNNLEDRDGALAALSQMIEPGFGLVGGSRDELESKLEVISAVHERDGDIAYRMAVIRERLGDYDAALLLINKAIELGNRSPRAYLRRATIFRYLKRDNEALNDARLAMASDKIESGDVTYAIHIMKELDPGGVIDIGKTMSLDKLDVYDQIQVSRDLMGSREMLPVVERMVREILTSRAIGDSIDARDMASATLVLDLIGQTRYKEAMSLLFKARPAPEDIKDVRDAFNYAIAEWGQLGYPPQDLFARVVFLAAHRRQWTDANFNQCLAMASQIVGEHKMARDYLARARANLTSNPKSNFSAWRYLEIGPVEFQKDLDQIEQMLNGVPIVPAFMNKNMATNPAAH